jgi:hypothetical protein
VEVDDTGLDNKALETYSGGLTHDPESEDLQDGRRRARCAMDKTRKTPAGAGTGKRPAGTSGISHFAKGPNGYELVDGPRPRAAWAPVPRSPRMAACASC